MSYEVGTHIDLRYLNKKKAVPTTQKKRLEAKTQELYQVGTRFIFTFTPAGKLQMAIKIPVALA